MRAWGQMGWCGLLLCAGLLAGCGRAEPEPVVPAAAHTVRAAASTNRITAGEPVRVSLEALFPAGEHVELPSLYDQPQLTVRQFQRDRQVLDEAWVRVTHTYTVTAFDLGVHPVVTGAVRFVAGGELVEERELPRLDLEVVSVIGDDEEVALAPMRPLFEAEVPWPRWLPVLLGVALGALLLGAVVAFYLSRRRTILQAAPPVPPHEVALNALRLLREQGYVEAGRVAAFYTELSAIVRTYLEGRFGLRAPELTTEEFIREAAGARVLTAAQQALVGGFLEQSDLVKFARFRPGLAEMEDALAAAERLIRETVPVVEDSEEGGRP
jgi:hypothetical protein